MPSVELERTPAGYAVRCVFRTLPAAMRGVDALLTVAEAAFEPPKPEIPAGIVPHDAGAVISAMLERAEQDDPPPHDGRTPLAYPVDEE